MPMLLYGNGSISGATSMPSNIQFGGTVGVTGALNTSSTFTSTGALTPSGGIAFPAAQYSSADANTLDDYEEGTWTPSISFGGGTTGITYASRSGGYIKIGAQVTVWGYISLSNKGSSTGTGYITGFPFTNANASGRAEGATVAFNYWNTFSSNVIPLAYLQNNSTQAYMLNGAPSQNIGALADTVFMNGSSVYFNCVYSTV